jgi:glycosyltransferase involved in cell wall biosynthesis
VASGIRGAAFALHRMLVQPWLLPRAARILVSSDDYARRSSLQRFFRKHAERVIELPFGVDTDFFAPGPATRNRFALPDGSPVILFVGGLDRSHAFKGTPELLTALSRLDPHAHLLIVGDGDLRPAYERLSQELNIVGRVHFLGRVDRPTLRDAYRTADVFAFPSTNTAEAFGLAALEAQACGVPIVASDLPGLRTVVRQGETGLLTPPKDVPALASALSTLLADRARREEMGHAARAWAASKFSWDRHLDGLLTVYRQVRRQM